MNALALTDGVMSSIQQSDLVFVYGTLRNGYGNNRLLKYSTYVGDRVTKDKYLLVGQGIPFLIEGDFDDLSLNVEGELYQVDELTLVSLDHLEGHPTGYKRKLVETTQGEVCWTYTWPHGFSMNHYVADVTEEGNYKW